MKKIGFDFSEYVDVAFRSCSQAFVPLSIALDIMMMYMAEGIKIIFRFTYAILKVNKQFIKKLHNPKEFIPQLKKNGRENTDCKQL